MICELEGREILLEAFIKRFANQNMREIDSWYEPCVYFLRGYTLDFSSPNNMTIRKEGALGMSFARHVGQATFLMLTALGTPLEDVPINMGHNYLPVRYICDLRLSCGV